MSSAAGIGRRHRLTAMPDPYDAVNVELDGIVDKEEMGSKKKFWYRDGEDLWLFKFPRENTGEHWAEKIAEQAASVLGVVHAEVELASFQEKRGTVTRSFARDGSVLHHGNQFLEKIVQDYDPEKKFYQSSHTVGNIWKTIENIFVIDESAKSAKTRMAEYIVVDALIGNTDRHHENWGILRRRVDNRWQDSVAPSFDHASSLGRELKDEHRDRYMAGEQVVFGKGPWRDLLFWERKTRSESVGTCAASASMLP